MPSGIVCGGGGCEVDSAEDAVFIMRNADNAIIAADFAMCMQTHKKRPPRLPAAAVAGAARGRVATRRLKDIAALVV